jgi:hypothetical protein
MKRPTFLRRSSTKASAAPRTGRYRVFGWILAASLFATLLLTAIGAIVVSALRAEILFTGLAIALLVLATGLVYLLFTLPKALRDLGESAYRALAAARSPGGGRDTVVTSAGSQIDYGRESRDIEILEGIGTVFSRRLTRAGITNLQELRQASEERVSAAAQVQPPVARRWKTMAELMLVQELDAQAAELLVHCGIETIDALAAETPPSLARKARIVNQSGKNRIYPGEISQSMVERWIDAARSFGRPGTVGSDEWKRRQRPAARSSV